MAELDPPSGQLQSPLVDDEVSHAASDAVMARFAADEELAVGRQQRRLCRDLHWRVFVDLHCRRLPSSGRSDVVEDPVVHSFLQ